MEPLTLMDARMPATVARWLDAWHQAAWLVHPSRLALTLGEGGLLVSLTTNGLWESTTFDRGVRAYTTHADRAALVAYVVAWARNTDKDN